MEKKNLKSKIFKGILISIGTVTIILLIFLAGSTVGYRKAAFSYKFGDNYHNIFDGHRPKSMDIGLPPRDLSTGHGAIGSIIKIDLPNIAVETPDGVERAITIRDKTIIKKFREDIQASSLKINDFIVIMGTPNNLGVIEANLIRITSNPKGVEVNR